MMKMAGLKQLVAESVREGGTAIVDYWLLGAMKIDVVVFDGVRLEAYVIARSEREAATKADRAAMLFEFFDAVSLIIPRSSSVPDIRGWIGVQRFHIDETGAFQRTISSWGGHCDLRYSGCLAHLKTRDIREMLAANGAPAPKRESRWSIEQAALELPLSTLRMSAMESIRARL